MNQKELYSAQRRPPRRVVLSQSRLGLIHFWCFSKISALRMPTSGMLCFLGTVFGHLTTSRAWLKPRKRGMLSTPLWLSKSRCWPLSSSLGGRDWASGSPLEATHQVSSSGGFFFSLSFFSSSRFRLFVLAWVLVTLSVRKAQYV